ncbi:MAG: PP0621 family protein [Rubrivivax sp.]
MKYLIVVLVVVFVAWLMLRGRSRDVGQRQSDKRARPQAMIVCAHCGVHMPRAEALVGQGQSFCSEAHKLAGPRPR